MKSISLVRLLIYSIDVHHFIRSFIDKLSVFRDFDFIVVGLRKSFELVTCSMKQ